MAKLWDRWRSAVDSEDRRPRLAAIAVPGLIPAFAMVIIGALSKRSVTWQVAVGAAFFYALVTVPIWCGSYARRVDRRAAEELLRREGWDEPIQFAGRPLDLGQVVRPRIWIATDRRLIEATRPRWWRTRETASPLRSVSYKQMIEIRHVKEYSGNGEMPLISIEIGLESGKLDVALRNSRAKALLATLSEHAGLAVPAKRRS